MTLDEFIERTHFTPDKCKDYGNGWYGGLGADGFDFQCKPKGVELNATACQKDSKYEHQFFTWDEVIEHFEGRDQIKFF